MRVGHYPLHHGTLGAVRSLGRAGVPVYTVTEHRFTPASRSRYAAGAFVLPTTGTEPPESLVAQLLRIGRRLGRPAVLVCTDDEAAVLVAEHREELSESFLLPAVPPGLPRLLASKQGLYELCCEFGIDSPISAAPRTSSELLAFGERHGYPLMVKNLEAFTRLASPAVRANTVVASRDALEALAERWREPYSVLVQEYIPPENAEDWFVHGYLGADAEPRVLFTGFKVRSWPPYAGVTTCGLTAANPGLAELSARFLRAIGYRGLLDLDWRLDRRDGAYRLLDFNPRLGAQFRIFENAAGVDVVRALHLDLSGREVPSAPTPDGTEIVLEHLDPAARLAYRWRGLTAPAAPVRPQRIRPGWFATDDLVPAGLAYAQAARQLAVVAGRAVAGLRTSGTKGGCAAR